MKTILPPTSILPGLFLLLLLAGCDRTVTPEKERARTPPPPVIRPLPPRPAPPAPPPSWGGNQTYIFPGAPPGDRPPGNYSFRPAGPEQTAPPTGQQSYAYPFTPGQSTPYGTPPPRGVKNYRFRPREAGRAGKRWTGNYR